MNASPPPTVLDLGSLLPGLGLLAVRHGSLPFAEAARQALLEGRWRRVALDLPAFCRDEFVAAVEHLPELHAATWIQGGRRWVLPADPCDAATVACRAALMERLELAFVDDEAAPGPEDDPDLPDGGAIEGIGAAEFAGICLPWTAAATDAGLEARGGRIARRLRELPPRPTLLVLRQALVPAVLRALASPREVPAEALDHDEAATAVERLPLEPRHALMALGEWPWIAQEAERLRADPFGRIPTSDRWLGRLYLFARARHLSRRKAARVSLAALRTATRFARRLARAAHASTPTLWDAVQAAKACVGDAFATAVLECAAFHGIDPASTDRLQLGRARARTPDDPPRPWSHRLLPRPARWATLRLRKEPDPEDAARWIRQWRPHSLCSHLPEDLAIERFHAEVRSRARSRSPSQETRSRPFESSLLDGLDLRETVRNAWRRELWVQERPARELKLDAAVLIFDDEHDDDHPHRGTWYAEHRDESTLVFYATDPARDPVGPGILRSRYGGLALLFPPRHVPDVFQEPTPPLGAANCAETLVAAACLFSRRHAIAYAAWEPPSLAVQDIARMAGKRLVHVPLSGFPPSRIEKLRTFHVLDGKDVRGWADQFIQGD